MITHYGYADRKLVPFDRAGPGRAGAGSTQAMWIDLEHPTLDEIHTLERELGINIPSADDMREIEVSRRLYQEVGAHFMTASVVYGIDTDEPLTSEITFILLPKALVTIRFCSPRAFDMFASHAKTGDAACDTPSSIAIGLLEAVIEREADLIERLQHEAESMSRRIFEAKAKSFSRANGHAGTLRRIGQVGVIASRTRESLVSLGRLLSYFVEITEEDGTGARVILRLRAAIEDSRALAAHVDFVSSRLTFMLDATIGLIGIEQTQIIKIFSVVAVMLMPPTLIASIYGMNFTHMPELGYVWAYPSALAAMVVSAIVPFIYFKHKGWL